MEQQICKNCKYFRQHYIMRRRQFAAANSGHCKYQKSPRNPDTVSNACKHFEPRDIQQEKESRTKSVRDMITDMSNQLEELLLVINAPE